MSATANAWATGSRIDSVELRANYFNDFGAWTGTEVTIYDDTGAKMYRGHLTGLVSAGLVGRAGETARSDAFYEFSDGHRLRWDPTHEAEIH